MSLSDYIQAMPKVELNVQLHGAMKPQTIITIAQQNDIPDDVKTYQHWLKLLNAPDYTKLDDLSTRGQRLGADPDDLKLLVYELATTLHKQNVRYAEIGVDPTLYSALNLQLDDFLSVINDGRDRAERAWGIRLAWIMMMPREEPRRVEDIARWATTVAARKGGIAGIGLAGRESLLPIGQFERPFKAAEKKETPRVVRAGDEQGVEAILKTLELLMPNRIIDGKGVAKSPEALVQMRDGNVALAISLTGALKRGWVTEIGEYPLRALYDASITVTLGDDMPVFYNTTLTNEYQQAVESGLLSVEELNEIALNAIRASFLPDDDKAGMAELFTAEYEQLGKMYLEE